MDGRLLKIRGVFCAVMAFACVMVAGCQAPQAAPKAEPIRISGDVFVQPIADGVWMHTTYRDLADYGRVGANGLVVIDGDKAALIDLPWTDEQTGVLFDWIANNRGAVVKTVIPTHFHEDCMGGLAEAHRRGTQSYGLNKTIRIAREKGLPVPQISYQMRTMIRCGRTVVLATYHGSGHTTDNVVAWLPQKGILFGGCLIKSLDAQSLGNTADGDVQAYPATLQKVLAAYGHAQIVVPGHGDWGGPELIEHTLKLCPGKSPKP